MRSNSVESFKNAVLFVLPLSFCFLFVNCKEKEVAAKSKNVKQPNIVFILSDDHAVSSISAYGNSMVQTPNIDRLAKNGVTFTNAFVTSSLCSPSRAGILNGQYGAKSGFKKIGDVFNGTVPTLPNILQKNNYQTALFGKWHLNSKPNGFDSFKIVKGQGKFFDPEFYTAADFDTDEGDVQNGYFSDIITDDAIRWIAQQKAKKPFALFIHHKAPHSPHVTPKAYDNLFIKDLPEPANYNDVFADNNSYLRDSLQPFSKLENAYAYDIYNNNDAKEAPAGIKKGTKEYKDWAYQTLYKGYYRQITNLDDNIGRVLDQLETSKMLDNTIIVYMSDNGWFTGEGGLFNKMWMYDASSKVPFIISQGNSIPKNKKSSAFISNIDVAPTLFDFAGISIPEEMQGKSLKNEILAPNKNQNDQTFFYHYYAQFGVPEQLGVRTNDYKLIRFVGENGEEYEFYDLKNDPMELTNKFEDASYQETIRELKVLLEQQIALYES